MAKKREIDNSPGLFDNLALEHNLESVKNEPLNLEEALNDENLIEKIKEHILSFARAYPIANVFNLTLVSFAHVNYELNDTLRLTVGHGYFSINTLNKTIMTNEDFNIQVELYDKKNKIKITSFKVNYENKFGKETLSKEELQGIELDKLDLEDKLKALPQSFYNYLHKDEVLIDELKEKIKQALAQVLDEDNNVIKNQIWLGSYQCVLLDWEDISNKRKIDIELIDSNNQRVFTNTFNKSLSKNKILATINHQIQTSIKGENDETRTTNATSESEAGGDLQQSSNPKPLSMGLTQPTSLNDSEESMSRKTSTKQGGEQFRENESANDERESTQTSSFTGQNYRLSNQANDREREREYHQSCERLARNSLSEDENLAKTSQNALNKAELVKEYEEALLKLYLSTKSQKELENFHKIKSLYEKLSDKFRQRDTHTKLEDKYQSQKDKLTQEQKEKMSEDFILALSTNTAMNLSEETSSFIVSNIYEKLSKLKETNHDLQESLEKLENIDLNFKDLQNTQYKIRRR